MFKRPSGKKSARTDVSEQEAGGGEQKDKPWAGLCIKKGTTTSTTTKEKEGKDELRREQPTDSPDKGVVWQSKGPPDTARFEFASFRLSLCFRQVFVCDSYYYYSRHAQPMCTGHLLWLPGCIHWACSATLCLAHGPLLSTLCDKKHLHLRLHQLEVADLSPYMYACMVGSGVNFSLLILLIVCAPP